MTGVLGFAVLALSARFLPGRLVVGLAALWWAGLALVTSPMMAQPNPLAQFVGGSFAGWLALASVAVVFAGYRAALSALRRRAAPVAPARPDGSFRPAELERYARHILLREIGGAGQKRLKAARVLVIGAGGLGSPALLYLAAAGVGTIGVMDADDVDASNLQRQIIHRDDSIGQPKVQSAAAAMRALNPFVTVLPYQRRLDAETAALIAEYDLILDGTDNFDTRYLVNRHCVSASKPLISAAITQWEGQISLYHPAGGGPCFECVFPTRPAPGLVPTCAEAGVAAALPGILGAMMAMEAIKHLTGAGETLRGRLMIYDALYAQTRLISAKRRVACPCCGQ